MAFPGTFYPQPVHTPPHSSCCCDHCQRGRGEAPCGQYPKGYLPNWKPISKLMEGDFFLHRDYIFRVQDRIVMDYEKFTCVVVHEGGKEGNNLKPFDTFDFTPDREKVRIIDVKSIHVNIKEWV